MLSLLLNLVLGLWLKMTNEEIIKKLVVALAFYAEPGTYHAISFIADRPCGGFGDDFAEDHGDDFYERAMPGDLARKTLREISTCTRE